MPRLATAEMSRHKLVKNIDLDDELDDFDGYSDDGGEEELSSEDKGGLAVVGLA